MKQKGQRFRLFRKRSQENHVQASTAMIAYAWRERTALHRDVESDPLVCEPDLPGPRVPITARITQILMDETLPDMDEWKTQTMETAIVGVK